MDAEIQAERPSDQTDESTAIRSGLAIPSDDGPNRFRLPDNNPTNKDTIGCAPMLGGALIGFLIPTIHEWIREQFWPPNPFPYFPDEFLIVRQAQWAVIGAFFAQFVALCWYFLPRK